MVSQGIVLFSVLTLAIYISNVESKEPLVVHDACDDNGLCYIKPENYPQEEIDRLMIKNLPNLHRMKRSAPALPMISAVSSSEYNCATTKVTTDTPYISYNKERVPSIIIQSRWFEQEVPKVFCSQVNQPCFTSLTLNSGTTYCRPKKASIKLYAYDTIAKNVELINTDIDIDCICMVDTSYSF